jgi:hypothetical protein
VDGQALRRLSTAAAAARGDVRSRSITAVGVPIWSW